MPLNFIPLPMMELRSAPGDVLDRVAHNNESFVIERNGNQMACLVPLSVFMPAIQPTRIAHEYEHLLKNGENPATSITDGRELQLQFKNEGTEKNITITIRLPHGYPNASPKVYAHPLPESCPHKWQDGSLCILGAMDVWNPGQHDVVHVLGLTRRWLERLSDWQSTGIWGGDRVDG